MVKHGKKICNPFKCRTVLFMLCYVKTNTQNKYKKKKNIHKKQNHDFTKKHENFTIGEYLFDWNIARIVTK